MIPGRVIRWKIPISIGYGGMKVLISRRGEGDFEGFGSLISRIFLLVVKSRERRVCETNLSLSLSRYTIRPFHTYERVKNIGGLADFRKGREAGLMAVADTNNEIE